jgi:hypothetical protein
MSGLPGFGTFLAVVLLFFGAGSVLGYMGRRTSWRTSMNIGSLCLAVAEPLLFVLYQQGFMSLIRAFYIGGAFLLVGTFTFGFGVQRMGKAQRAESKASAPRK